MGLFIHDYFASRSWNGSFEPQMMPTAPSRWIKMNPLVCFGLRCQPGYGVYTPTFCAPPLHRSDPLGLAPEACPSPRMPPRQEQLSLPLQASLGWNARTRRAQTFGGTAFLFHVAAATHTENEPSSVHKHMVLFIDDWSSWLMDFYSFASLVVIDV